MGSRRTSGAGIIARLDQLNEFERAPVAVDKLHGGSYFAATFAGEHIAATEFVIGALFVKFGAQTRDVLLGLLVGNLLAVLSWMFVCAPIAVQTRLTLYWYLRKIAGPVVTVLYNLANAGLYCILAGAMITVSASAVRLWFGIPPQTDWYPRDGRFVLVVIAVGAVVVTLAVAGFKRLALFASICSPWMVVMFVAGALCALPGLGHVRSWSDFLTVANERIWAGPSAAVERPMGFWHVAAFAWICNLGWHVGLSDMALFRYAKRSCYAAYSAYGMYLGHYLSWICAGIMGAAAAKATQLPLGNLDSGQIAYEALGAVGALTVVIAGWTTANPTLYRAGLALQVATPGWPRWLVTLAVGAITTVIACFPFVFTGLLGFVAILGLVMMPIGAIVVIEHWVFPALGWTRFWSTRRGDLVNWPALAAWVSGLASAWALWKFAGVHEFFLTIPVWLITSGAYLFLAGLSGARQSLPELPPEPVAAPHPQTTPVRTPTNLAIYRASGLLSLATLVILAALAVAVFLERCSPGTFRTVAAGVTVVYFISATVWICERERLKLAGAS